MEILCLAMQLRFEKRDVRKKQLLTPGNLSPAVVDYIFDTDIPRPCRWFLGREQELEQLHALLVDHSKVFLHGIPGIGKSELAKAYAKQHGKEYTNVIYVNYPGHLKQAVIDLDFADDLPDESDDTRFKRHNRFLRSLREDTLLIVDNFNVIASQDQFLDVMLKYRCRILFTTRSRYENHISLEVGELNPDTLLELVSKFFPETEKKQDEIGQIIDLLHGHTFAVELAARLLANGLLKPKALLDKLEKEKAALDAEDKIGTTKDGRNSKKQIELVQEAIRVLGEVHSGNAHLAANLHANLGALYHKSGRIDFAKPYMEQGVRLLEEYNLTGYHDSVTQICNYAALLTDLGEPQRAYSALLKLARKVQKLNSDQCLDYGLIQQVMGSICVVKGDTAQAQLHHQRAMAIFEMVFEDEPALLEQKRQEIGQAALVSRQKNQKLLV